MLRTRLPLTVFRIATKNDPLDLHALDTPPTFVLSQDQTLNKNILRERKISIDLHLVELFLQSSGIDDGHGSLLDHSLVVQMPFWDR